MTAEVGTVVVDDSRGDSGAVVHGPPAPMPLTNVAVASDMMTLLLS